MRVFRRKDKVTKRPIGPWLAWWYDATGKRQQRSTKQTDKRAAEIVAAQWERDTADPRNATANQATLKGALELFVKRKQQDAKAGHRSERTVEFYRQKAGHWRRLLGDEFKLKELTSAEVDEFISKRRDEGASDHTIKKELNTLQGALKTATRAGLWRGNLMEVLPAFSANYTPRTTALQPAELSRLLRELLPDRAARVAFYVATGARYSEAEHAAESDISADHSSVHLRGTKTEAADRHVPIVANWQKTLLAYALKYHEGNLFLSWSLGSTSRDLAKACRRAGCRATGHLKGVQLKHKCERMDCVLASIPRVTPNDLRRTFATWLRLDEVPLELVAPLLGHTTTVMVQKVYGKLTPAQLAERLRNCSRYAALTAETVVQNGQSGNNRSVKGVEFTEEVARSTRFERVTCGFEVPTSTVKQQHNPAQNTVHQVWVPPKRKRRAANVQQPRKRGTQ